MKALLARAEKAERERDRETSWKNIAKNCLADALKVVGEVKSARDNATARAEAAEAEVVRLRGLLTRKASKHNSAPMVLESLRACADRVRAHSGYDPGGPLDELATDIEKALHPSRWGGEL